VFRNALGVRPRAKTWAEFKRKELLRLVLTTEGPVPTDAATTLLGEALGIRGAQNSTEVVDQFIARSLGLRDSKVTLGGIRAALLANKLGVPIRPTFSEVVRLASAKLSGAQSGHRDHVLAALVGKYMRGQLKPRAASNGGHAPVGGDIDEGDEAIRTFVAKVLAAAGSGSVRPLVRESVHRLGLGERQERREAWLDSGVLASRKALLEAHRLGALTLSR